jgi:hypothetical protein
MKWRPLCSHRFQPRSRPSSGTFQIARTTRGSHYRDGGSIYSDPPDLVISFHPLHAIIKFYYLRQRSGLQASDPRSITTHRPPGCLLLVALVAVTPARNETLYSRLYAKPKNAVFAVQETLPKRTPLPHLPIFCCITAGTL